jgi:hypothetical protein
MRWQDAPPGKINGQIIECKYDHDWPNNWKFTRFRSDKLTANHISTYEKILVSIDDNVTEEAVFYF